MAKRTANKKQVSQTRAQELKGKGEKITLAGHEAVTRGHSDGRQLVHVTKYPKEAPHEYHARLRIMGVGKRFRSGHVTDCCVPRCIQTGTAQHELIVLSDSERAEIDRRFNKEVQEAESMPEASLADHAKMRMEVKRAEMEAASKEGMSDSEVADTVEKAPALTPQEEAEGVKVVDDGVDVPADDDVSPEEL